MKVLGLIFLFIGSSLAAPASIKVVFTVYNLPKNFCLFCKGFLFFYVTNEDVTLEVTDVKEEKEKLDKDEFQGDIAKPENNEDPSVSPRVSLLSSVCIPRGKISA